MITGITLPLHEPILIFTVIIVIVFLVPLLLKRMNIPDIIGLIVAGVIIGPKGFNILSGDIALSIFGTIGLLYLMFLAGLEIDLNDFFRKRREGTLFGVLTFLFPFVPGFIVFYYLLNFRFETSLLVATMLASHTLVSYPLLGRLGIINHRIVTITIAGTIIADTVVLVILGIVSDSVQGDLSFMFWIRTLVCFSLFFVFVLYLLPKATRWIFKYQSNDSSTQYIFVLAAIFVSATFAELLGIEPLIGAFFTGLSLNRYIPRTSPLMNRVVFIGNTLFIPFFLVSIGMLVDAFGLFTNPGQWVVSGTLIVVALGGKWLAAWILQISLKLSISSRNLVFGLSTARAASAIAVMIVGQEFDLVSDSLFNGTVFLILVSSIVSSVVTQKAGQNLILKQGEEQGKKEHKVEKILVSISNPDNIEQLTDFSLLVKDPKSQEPIYPISVVLDGKRATSKIEENRKILNKALQHASSANKNTKLITRIDVNVVDGIARTIKELGITKILVGWNPATTTIDRLFGSFLDRLLRKTNKMVMVCRLENHVALTGNFHVFLPHDIQTEIGFVDMLFTLHNLARHVGRSINYYGSSKVLQDLKDFYGNKKAADFKMTEGELSDFFFKRFSMGNIPPNDLLVFVKTRRYTLSHTRLMDRYPKIINQYFCSNNLVLIYPEQQVFKKELFHLYNMN